MSSHIRSIEDASAEMINILEQILPIQTICVALHTHLSHQVIASFNRREPLLRNGFELPTFQLSTTRNTASQPTAIIDIPNVSQDSRTSSSELAKQCESCSFFAILVQKPDQPMFSASICLVDRAPIQLSEEQLCSLHSAASMLGYMIELEAASLTDSLTGLYNRRYLHHILDRGTDKQYSVLFIDIDDFKEVNDRYGHDAGDALLQNIAMRLKQNVRNSDILIRYGGDEFLVCCQHLSGNHDMHFVADKIKMTLKQPYTVNGRNLQVSASVGISAGHGNSTSLKQLITDADQAMYNMKQYDIQD